MTPKFGGIETGIMDPLDPDPLDPLDPDPLNPWDPLDSLDSWDPTTQSTFPAPWISAVTLGKRALKPIPIK